MQLGLAHSVKSINMVLKMYVTSLFVRLGLFRPTGGGPRTVGSGCISGENILTFPSVLADSIDFILGRHEDEKDYIRNDGGKV